MPTPTEIARLAAAVNVLRPDWPANSLATLLTTKHAHRPAHDLAVALVFVATDPATRTPARINESGPWWHVGQGYGGASGPWDRKPCPTCSHVHDPDGGHRRRDPEATERGAAEARAAIRRTDPSDVA